MNIHPPINVQATVLYICTPLTPLITLVFILKVGIFFQLHKNIFRAAQIDLELHILSRTAAR